jgi:hypothetical protein
VQLTFVLGLEGDVSLRSSRAAASVRKSDRLALRGLVGVAEAHASRHDLPEVCANGCLSAERLADGRLVGNGNGLGALLSADAVDLGVHLDLGAVADKRVLAVRVPDTLGALLLEGRGTLDLGHVASNLGGWGHGERALAAGLSGGEVRAFDLACFGAAAQAMNAVSA